MGHPRQAGLRLLQKTDFGGSRELFVKGEDLSRAVGESDLSNQMIGEAAAGGSGGFDGLLSAGGGFDGDAAGVEKAFESGENPFRGPARAKDPGEFGEDDQGQEDAAFGAGLGQRPAGSLRLSRIIVEEGTRPDVGVGDDHREAFRTFAAFISLKEIRGPGLPA